MSDIDMACAKLKNVLDNPSAILRYTTMHDVKSEHSGWVKQKNKSTLRPRTRSRYL